MDERRAAPSRSRSFSVLFPLLALLLLDTAFVCVGGWLWMPAVVTSSPNLVDTTFSFQGIHLADSPTASAWRQLLFASLASSLSAQEAMFVAWAVFARGKWYLRLAATLTATALLVGLLQLRMAAPIGDWKEAIGPYLLLPIVLLSLAAPLSVYAVWSGRRLCRVGSVEPISKGGRHFSIANIMTLTAGVAMALAIARLHEDSENESRIAWIMLIYSAIYVLPLTWCALAIRRRWLSLGAALLIAAAFSVPFSIIAIKFGDWPASAGTAAGLIWTVPVSLLLWRCCGYRLAGTE